MQVPAECAGNDTAQWFVPSAVTAPFVMIVCAAMPGEAVVRAGQALSPRHQQQSSSIYTSIEIFLT
jgi:hypothetical protein